VAGCSGGLEARDGGLAWEVVPNSEGKCNGKAARAGCRETFMWTHLVLLGTKSGLHERRVYGPPAWEKDVGSTKASTEGITAEHLSPH